MKLIAETDAANERRYQIAFDVITRSLGIENMPQTVWLSFVSEPPELLSVRRGQVLRKKLGGSTNNTIVDGYVQMQINDHRSTCGCAACREEAERLDPISTFCHEMAHVKQLVKGELRRTSAGMWWHGRFYRHADVPKYHDQPWEHEANRLQADLTPKVRAAIAAAT